MKKKKFTVILLLTFFFIYFADNTSASTIPEIIYQDDDFIVTSTVTIYDSDCSIKLYSTSNTKNASKMIHIKDGKGVTLATYTLNATFTYNGKTSTCTKTNYSSSIKKSGWSFSSRTTSKNGNKAYGSCVLKSSNSTKKYSGSIQLSCTKNGVIS